MKSLHLPPDLSQQVDTSLLHGEFGFGSGWCYSFHISLDKKRKEYWKKKERVLHLQSRCMHVLVLLLLEWWKLRRFAPIRVDNYKPWIIIFLMVARWNIRTFFFVLVFWLFSFDSVLTSLLFGFLLTVAPRQFPSRLFIPYFHPNHQITSKWCITLSVILIYWIQLTTYHNILFSGQEE